MLEKLKEDVYRANLRLTEYNLVILTWGNVSGIDRDRGLVVIKPSGVDYGKMTPADMVVLNLEGEKVEGELNPSSDTPTHLELYRRFPGIGGIAHTHSSFAVGFAQAAKDIRPYGTTHADFAFGPVPCTRDLSPEDIRTGYELNTGKVIAECFEERGMDYNAVPAVLVHSHGPFTWGAGPFAAAKNSLILEEVAKMAYLTESLGAEKEASKAIQKKHYMRKHGPDAYYGQK
ncbi:MAG: L-ribulose-5-phosphate 4-epimerase [Clostridia bacterium]|nr:L-ribulose-5-phosphate 4-epimerase [Clostridia bacterium]